MTDNEANIERRNAVIRKYRKQGWTLREIAEEVGLSIGMVSRICREVGYSGTRGLNNAKTREVGRFIYAYMEKHCGRSPEFREISRGVMGTESERPMSTYIVSQKLEVLHAAGIIRLPESSIARGIQIVGAQYILPELPDELKEEFHDRES